MVIVLGTRSSIWDALFEAYEDAVDDSAMVLAEEISGTVNAGTASNASLEKLSEWVSDREKIPFHLRVVPEGLDHGGQMETLRTLAEAVPGKSELHMCVTHGLRHMPMLQMLSVFHLAETAGVVLGGLYYGGLELGSNGLECPVVELTGAAELHKWSLALGTLNTTGRLSALADAAQDTDSALAEQLRETDFRQAVNQTGRAALSAVAAAKTITQRGLPGAGGLFSKAASARLTWAGHRKLGEKQRLCARQALDTGDLMRCVILCLEAFISKAVPNGIDERDYRQREDAYRDLLSTLSGSDRQDLKTLEYLRNAVAHGSATDNQSVRDLLDKPSTLRAFLRKMLTKLGQP